MLLRKMKPEEHPLTRPLWEKIFTEDSNDFLDYYYNNKTKNNEIYVIETDGEIRSMLQLNPYHLVAGTKEVPGRYIVAVATDSFYRGKGFLPMWWNRAPLISPHIGSSNTISWQSSSGCI